MIGMFPVRTIESNVCSSLTQNSAGKYYLVSTTPTNMLGTVSWCASHGGIPAQPKTAAEVASFRQLMNSELLRCIDATKIFERAYSSY